MSLSQKPSKSTQPSTLTPTPLGSSQAPTPAPSNSELLARFGLNRAALSKSSSQYEDMCNEPMSPQSVAPSGEVEVVYCEGANDGAPAFDAKVYVIGPDGTVVDEANGNTLPANPDKAATVPAGEYDFQNGNHTFPSSKKTIPAFNVGSDTQEGFERKVPLNGPNPNPSTSGDNYARQINMHHGSSNNRNADDRWSEGCLTTDKDDWQEQRDAIWDAQLQPENTNLGGGKVHVVRPGETNVCTEPVVE